LLHLDGQVHHDTHTVPMGNYVIEVGNSVIVSPSDLGNYKIADTQEQERPGQAAARDRGVSGAVHVDAGSDAAVGHHGGDGGGTAEGVTSHAGHTMGT